MPLSSPVKARWDGVIWLIYVREFLVILRSPPPVYILGPAVIGTYCRSEDDTFVLELLKLLTAVEAPILSLGVIPRDA